MSTIFSVGQSNTTCGSVGSDSVRKDFSIRTVFFGRFILLINLWYSWMKILDSIFAILGFTMYS